MSDEILLVYDRECPACDHYCRLVRIRESVGELKLVNARDDHPVMAEITAAGLDIDDGMVLKVGSQLYYGADAITALALMGSDSGWFNRLNFLVFRSARVASILYPVLAACRGLLLKILRKTRINNLQQEGRDRF
ncbi:MAG: DUF393 domain-containing protein [Gammaproteobacteria bacterium]|nr:DUF393 domain-containing protein [Gammaproteobacteria bacterium]